MRASGSVRPLVGAVLALAAILGIGGEAAADDAKEGAEGGAATVAVLVEVWRVTDGNLVAELDAMTEKAPGDVEAVRTRLRAEGDRTRRVSRFLTPAAAGTPVLHSDVQKLPTVTRTGTSGGTVRGGFGGYVEVGTTVKLRCELDAAGEVSVALKLTASGVEKPPPSDEPSADVHVSPTQWVAQVDGDVRAPSGVARMFQSNAHERDTLFVFVRPTVL